MKGIDLLGGKVWKPFAAFGLDHPFFSINAHTVTNTWITLLVLLLLLLPIRYFLKHKLGVVRYILITFIKALMDLTQQTLNRFSFKHFSFFAAIFIFIVFCNIISIIPWVEEPTRDINTTLALGLISFIYTQTYAIKHQGLWGYLKEYFAPFFLMAPLNIIGELATIVSLSFRLFGNIFGGSIISTIYFSVIQGSVLFETLGLLSGINFGITIFFTLFEGFLQAFVFSMLTLTYLSIAIQEDEEEAVVL